MNKEIEAYYKILSKDYPKFIDKYINTDSMQRLSTIGQFCDADYTKIHSCKYWFSRLDHSIACALMTYKFTKDKKQVLATLFHDLGTPSFSHCVDYLLNDFINQESSERSIKDVILKSPEIINYLHEDRINIEDVVDASKYTIMENKKPKICVDRLEGIIGTGIVWCHFWNLEDVKEIYENITILKNKDGEDEIGFKTVEIADKFFEGVFKYSISLQKNDDKFAMQFVADILKCLISKKIIELDDLYKISEKEIIEIIKQDKDICESWKIYENTTKVNSSDEKPNNIYYASLNCKKRYVIPLVISDDKIARLNEVSKKCEILLDEYLNYEDKEFSYVEKIKQLKF